MNKFAILVFISFYLTSCASNQEDELGYKGYNSDDQTVKEVLLKLKNDPGINIRTDRGWTIASSQADGVIWSFTPPGHPAHPSFVKREVLEKDGRIYLETNVQCGAKKPICDELVRDFIDLNNKVREEISDD